MRGWARITACVLLTLVVLAALTACTENRRLEPSPDPSPSVNFSNPRLQFDSSRRSIRGQADVFIGGMAGREAGSVSILGVLYLRSRDSAAAARLLSARAQVLRGIGLSPKPGATVDPKDKDVVSACLISDTVRRGWRVTNPLTCEFIDGGNPDWDWYVLHYESLYVTAETRDITYRPWP